MSILQKISLGYFVALMIAASLNYIPGLTDDQGLAFGIFALDLFDDALAHRGDPRVRLRGWDLLCRRRRHD